MIDFSTLRELIIPEGAVTQIEVNGTVLFNANKFTHTVVFNANGGSGSMTSIVGNRVTISSNTFTQTGYDFAGWNTAADGSGISYSNGQIITLTEDITLYAQWAIKYFTLTFRHSENSDLHGPGDTGPTEYYALWINGVEQSDLGDFSNSARTYSLPYGTPIGVIAQVKYGNGSSHVTVNGTNVTGNSKNAQYTFTLTSNTDVHFIWTYAIKDSWTEPLVSYWKCNITT